jgi:PAP2 superfamily
MTTTRMRRAGLLAAGAVLAGLGAAAPARADSVSDWNAHATDALITNARQSPTVSTIHLAMVHGAVYDAVNSIDGRYEPYLVKVRAKRSYSQDAAAVTAAYRVLAGLQPGQQESLANHYRDSLAGIPPGRARDGGVAVGAVAAAAMLAARADDGRFPANPYRFPAPATLEEPWPLGQWRPVGSATANDPAAWVKDVTPFLIDDPGRFGSGGPNPLGGRRYAREFNEVKLLGAVGSERRSDDQTDAARFWMEGPAIWTRVTRQLASGLSPADGARLYARLYLPASDAVIACWQDKARWLFWRPVTAIHAADRDGNPHTEADRDWAPLINNPPYPDHPSGLACVSSAMAGSLADFFGTDRVAFSERSESSNTTRRFSGFSDAVREVVDARVWSGIHFRTADEDGARIGAAVARYWQQHAFGRER